MEREFTKPDIIYTIKEFNDDYSVKITLTDAITKEQLNEIVIPTAILEQFIKQMD